MNTLYYTTNYMKWNSNAETLCVFEAWQSSALMRGLCWCLCLRPHLACYVFCVSSAKGNPVSSSLYSMFLEKGNYIFSIHNQFPHPDWFVILSGCSIRHQEFAFVVHLYKQYKIKVEWMSNRKIRIFSLAAIIQQQSSIYDPQILWVCIYNWSFEIDH